MPKLDPPPMTAMASSRRRIVVWDDGQLDAGRGRC
jgi:hypothetical protein